MYGAHHPGAAFGRPEPHTAVLVRDGRQPTPRIALVHGGGSHTRERTPHIGDPQGQFLPRRQGRRVGFCHQFQREPDRAIHLAAGVITAEDVEIGPSSLGQPAMPGASRWLDPWTVMPAATSSAAPVINAVRNLFMEVVLLPRPTEEKDDWMKVRENLRPQSSL